MPMDEARQQALERVRAMRFGAALVEQAIAGASLEDQADALHRAVGTLRLAGA